MKLKLEHIIYIFACAFFIFVLVLESRPKKDKKIVVQEFNLALNENIVKATIYCTYTYSGHKENNYKIIITDKVIINEFKQRAKKIYDRKYFSGHFAQEYFIQLEYQNHKSYGFGYYKQTTAQDDECINVNTQEVGPVSNAYNDCGQLLLLHKPIMTDEKFFGDLRITSTYSFFNIDLIPFIIEYADNAPFDGKTKVRFYTQFELDRIKEQNKK